MKENKKKMSLHIWKYFTLFSIIIMITLWLLQIILFSAYYETMKIRELKSIGNEVLLSYGSDNFEKNTEKTAFVQGVSIGVFDSDINIIHSTDTYNFRVESSASQRPTRDRNMSGAVKEAPDFGDMPRFGNNNPEFKKDNPDFKKEPPDFKRNSSDVEGQKGDRAKNGRGTFFKDHQSIKEMEAKRIVELFGEGSGDTRTHTEKNRNFGKMITYAARKPVDNGYVYAYVKAALPPSNYTIDILRTQLIMVTILSLIIAFILSYFFSKKLTKPIENITRSAELLAEGDYSAEFEETDYFELNRLSSVLNIATKEIEKTEALRNDLMANVSHDLRTPLTIIRSYAEMIRDLSGENPQKREQHTNVIIKETDRLSLLVTDMLDLSKYDSGIHPKDIKEVSVSELVESAMTSFRIMTEKDDYIIETDIQPDIKCPCDERMINQAVYNLVSNALNYTGEDKKVFIKLYMTDDNKVRFEVKDTGKGISEEEKLFVWDRYYKSSRTHTREVEGSGLGLSIVKNILEVHNARYGVESTLGEGSVFWFELNTVLTEGR